MAKFHFFRFEDCEDGKMSVMESVDEHYPVNICTDNYEEVADLQECDVEIDVYGIGSDIEVFESEETFAAKPDNHMAPISLIPVGTFAIEANKDTFEPSPHVLFAGRVISVERNPEDSEDQPNFLLGVETLGMTLNLYLRYEGDIQLGFIVYGIAWLFGDIEKIIT